MPKDNFDNWKKEQFIAEIKKLRQRKKYGIVWDEEKNPEKVVLECKEKLPVLKEIKAKEIKTDKEKPKHILIEGDNFHALSVLNYTHKGKIDLIYIDPPYNTGNGETFRFNDKIVEKEDTYRHSKWLSFMNKRLLLAKNLLKKNGLFFVSIDDNEFAQLKLLCDELFGEDNFLAAITWQSSDTLRNDAKHFSPNSEFILCYAKNKIDVKLKGILKGEKQKSYYKNSDNDSRGAYLLTPLHAKSGTEKSKFEFKFSNNQVWSPPEGRYWAFSKESLLKLDKENRLYLDPNGKNVPQKKTYLSEVNERMPIWTFWRHEEFGSTRQSNSELRDLLGRGVFDNPKPTKLMKIIIDSAMEKTGTVLDFFAGSGTTGHAVLELNVEDDGKRKFILCTNNENNICTEVCYPRIEKVANDLENKAKGKIINKRPAGLKYFKTDFVEAGPTDKNKRKLVAHSTEMLCLKEDCFESVLEGSKFRIFKNNDSKYLGIIYDDAGIEPFKKEVRGSDKKYTVYVFSLDESAREDEFDEVIDKVDLKPIPEVILNVYRRIFK